MVCMGVMWVVCPTCVDGCSHGRVHHVMGHTSSHVNMMDILVFLKILHGGRERVILKWLQHEIRHVLAPVDEVSFGHLNERSLGAYQATN